MGGEDERDRVTVERLAKTLVRRGRRFSPSSERRTEAKTLRRAETSAPPVVTDASVEGPTFVDDGFDARYATESLLGAGGMGEVRLCHDKRVGRHVAMKVILPDLAVSRSASDRFHREARLQGQLEHPSVVPVYDLGVTPRGEAYFTMKRLRGHTLEEVLNGLYAKDPEITERFTRRRLLVAFASVCLAVSYAHDRDVLHRDLKPGNIMLGQYGEVHLLDWGLAKITPLARDPSASVDDARASDHQLEDVAIEDVTQTGHVLGTVGYMPPEQARGQIEELDARSDVYSLGSILFEILTLKPLFPETTIEDVLLATVAGADARASVRYPELDVPPELEEICVRATATRPEDRFPSARALGAAVERFLDGDRDLALRKKLAIEHAERAAQAARASLTARGDEAPAQAQRALREASSALTLDPTNAAALQAIARLLATAPATVPEEAKAEVELQASESASVSRRATFYVYLACILLAPGGLALGIKSWGAFLGAFLTGLLACLGAWLTAKGVLGRVGVLASYSLGVVVITIVSTLAGSLILIPGMTAMHTLGAVVFGEKRDRWLLIALGTMPLVLPYLAQVLGLMSPAYTFEADKLIVHSLMTHLPPMTGGVLLLASSMMIVAPALFLGQVKDTLASAELRLFLHAWTLRRILPEAVGAAASPKKSSVPPPPAPIV